MDPSGLEALTAFTRVAEARSVTAAAITLAVSPSAVGHTIRQLEKRLGVRLLNRTTRSVSLMEAGANFLRRVGPLVAELRASVEDSADAVAQAVRVHDGTTVDTGHSARFLDGGAAARSHRRPDLWAR